jgi:superoxide dismutase
MEINIEWDTFHQKYLNQDTVFILETEDTWEFYTSDKIFTVKCIVEKQANQEENIMFVERYLSGHTNFIKIIMPKEVEEEDDIEEELEPEGTG